MVSKTEGANATTTTVISGENASTVTVARGDKVTILSPASIINPDYVAGAVATLEAWGLRPEVMPHTLGKSGSFSGSAAERLADFAAALRDPDVKLILCSRGGYGCVHLLPELDGILAEPEEAAHPKWLVGFSDVTALHALWGKHGWPSVHASMAKQLTLGGPDDPLNRRLLSILGGTLGDVALPTGFSGSVYGRDSRLGRGTGRVVGGNAAVFGGLIGTPYSQIAPGTILVLEDVAEPIYKIERILWQLRLAGVLDRLAGLVVGQFTEYRHPSADHEDMYQMISRVLGPECPFPVAMDVPVGHIDGNIPIPMGFEATLEVDGSGATLHYNLPK